MQDKLLVMIQSQACRYIQIVERRPLILRIKCLSPVGSSTAGHTIRSFQPVITVVVPHAETLTIRQREHTFQLGHHPALVRLQDTVAIKIDSSIRRGIRLIDNTIE